MDTRSAGVYFLYLIRIASYHATSVSEIQIVRPVAEALINCD